MVKKFLSILVLSILLVPIAVLADNIVVIENPLGEGTQFQDIVDRLIDFIFNIAIIVAPLMIMVGAFLLVTAGGNAQQVIRAKNLMLWTAIGFAIVLFSKGILVIINQLLGVE